MRKTTIALTVLGLAFAGPVLAACGGSDTKEADAMEGIAPADAGTIIDVRDDAEWQAGHLDGAVQLSFNTGEFAAALDGMDKAADYTIYCRSGNRSGQAVELMRDAGFTGTINDLGPVENAAAVLGLDIVTD
jgi:phage shock protein E